MKIDWTKLSKLSDVDKVAVKFLAWVKNYMLGSAAFIAATQDPDAARKRYAGAEDTFGLIALGLEWGALLAPSWATFEPKARAFLVALALEALRKAIKL